MSGTQQYYGAEKDARIAELVAERDALREALEWYAYESDWNRGAAGDVARAALERPRMRQRDSEREKRIERIAKLIRSGEATEIEKFQRSMLDYGSMDEWAEAHERVAPE